MKIIITGYPNSGKSTLADILCLATPLEFDSVMRTDDLLNTHDWSEISASVSEWFDKPGPWVIEGVACPRAIRKWRARNPNGKPPFDMFIYIRRPHTSYRAGQRSMSKGMETVMLELWTWMADNDVIVIRMGPGPDEEDYDG